MGLLGSALKVVSPAAMLAGGMGGAQSTKTEPWSGVKNKLIRTANDVDTAYKEAQANPFSGATYAGLTGQQNNAVNNITAFADGKGQNVGSQLSLQALSLMDQGSKFGQNANRLMKQYGGNATSGVLGRVGQYMNDKVMNGQINAMKQSVNQNAHEQLAGMAGQYAGSGNTNSGRAGVTDAIVMRDANNTIAAQEAGMRGDAYSQALGAAQNDYFGGAQTAMGVNSQVGQGADMAQQYANNGLNYQQALSQNLMTAGGVLQQDQQNRLNDAQTQWQQKYYQPFENINQSMAAYGPMMGAGTQTQGSQGSGILQTALGAGMVAGGFMTGNPMMAMGGMGTMSGGMNGSGGMSGGNGAGGYSGGMLRGPGGTLGGRV